MRLEASGIIRLVTVSTLDLVRGALGVFAASLVSVWSHNMCGYYTMDKMKERLDTDV
jgi:hypothetical protein